MYQAISLILERSIRQLSKLSYKMNIHPELYLSHEKNIGRIEKIGGIICKTTTFTFENKVQ